MSKLKKQNFDLKLELFHRRQQNEALEAKLENLDNLQLENEELKHRNKDLLRELEFRDLAISEAVAIICEMEAKIEKMEPDPDPGQGDGNLQNTPIAHHSQTSDYQDQSLTIRPPSELVPGDPPTITNAAKTVWRAPSFLKDNKKSTRALRGLYLADDNSAYDNPSSFSLSRPVSRFSGDENQHDLDLDSSTLNSPRLSMLSESSFLSVYGKDKQADSIPARKKKRRSYSESSSEDEQTSPTFRQHEARTQTWINEGRKQNALRRKAPRERSDSRFSSIDEVVDVLPIEWRTEQTTRKLPIRSPSRRKRDDRMDFALLPPQGRTIFGHDVLPPTPDTMSISNRGTNSSTPSIITEKSLLDGAAKTYKAPITEARPQSKEGLSAGPNLSAALVFDEDADQIKWESEHDESTPVAHSNAGTIGHSPETFPTSTFMGTSSSTKQQVAGTPPRPVLTTYPTNMMFNGEDFTLVQPSRTISFPAPTMGKPRRRSVQFPPVGYEATGISKTTVDSVSAKSRPGVRTPIVTPTKEHRGAQTPDGRKGGQVSLSDAENEPRQSSTARLKNLFLGKRGSPSIKSSPEKPNGENLGVEKVYSDVVESSTAESREVIHPARNRQRRPSSIQLSRGSNPLPELTAGSRIAGPTSSTRRYSGVSALPDPSGIVGSQATGPSDKVPLDMPNPDGGVALPHGQLAYSETAHQRAESESRASCRANENKWSFGIGRSGSSKVKDGFSALRNRQK